MSVIKKFGRECLFPLILSTGGEKLFRTFNSKSILILNYHGVVKNFEVGLTKNHLPEAQFHKHLQYLKDNFDVISLSEAFSLQKHKSGDRKKIVITFDDGYENNYTSAFPLLKNFNFPATIFITAQAVNSPELPLWYDILDILNSQIGYPDLRTYLQKVNAPGIELFHSYSEFKTDFKQKNPSQKSSVLDDLLSFQNLKETVYGSNEEYWKLLSTNQIKELAQSGIIEIGSHGVTHTNLDTLGNENLDYELSNSKAILENISGQAVTSIAFPDGAYNDLVKAKSRLAGFKHLLAVTYKLESDLGDSSILPRLSISNTTTYESVMLQINMAFKNLGF